MIGFVFRLLLINAGAILLITVTALVLNYMMTLPRACSVIADVTGTPECVLLSHWQRWFSIVIVELSHCRIWQNLTTAIVCVENTVLAWESSKIISAIRLNTDSFDSGSWMQTWYIDIMLKNASILMIVLCLLLARNPCLWVCCQRYAVQLRFRCPTSLGNLCVTYHKRETVPEM